MRATIKNYIDALKARREELGEENDKGFSLIELIVVVVILGILAAIAIPIFLNIQAEARQNAAAAIAGNAATQAASQIAQGQAVSLSNLDTDGAGTATVVTYKDIVPSGGTAGSIEGICVIVEHEGAEAKAGPQAANGACTP